MDYTITTDCQIWEDVGRQEFCGIIREDISESEIFETIQDFDAKYNQY